MEQMLVPYKCHYHRERHAGTRSHRVRGGNTSLEREEIRPEVAVSLEPANPCQAIHCQPEGSQRDLPLTPHVGQLPGYKSICLGTNSRLPTHTSQETKTCYATTSRRHIFLSPLCNSIFCSHEDTNLVMHWADILQASELDPLFNQKGGGCSFPMGIKQ
ncbi:hypothetical protein AV530_009092 [Patagioenas fasciata monilis]|uniref:Uncharacterized protein n=1 Tax=Patagioenas fasciata monilis TaxID=372326 RepID=A0A1V4L1J2_PATFA|nr:hypothetical protein AV530_009092 [Patagioenas fasciata monilis]